jgi:dihydroorotate dehydrogenase (NAD+) catalytic subunit
MDFQIPVISSACPLEITPELNLLGAVITKTVTMQEIEGNPSELHFFENGMSINRLGLANPGIDKFIANVLPRYRQQVEVPLILSVFVSGLEEFEAFMAKVKPCRDNFAGIELNISCPNYKPVYNLKEILESFAELDYELLTVKLGATVDDDFLAWLYSIKIRWINCFNTIPLNTLIHKGRGGIGGTFLKELYLPRIKRIRSSFDFNIIATGGVSKGSDVKDYLEAGASLVGVASYFLENRKNIERLVTDYVNL